MKRRRAALWLGAVAVLLLLLALLLRIVLQPARVAGFVLDGLGESLGLEISAAGVSEYRLRGKPVLVVRDLVAREPGAGTPLLRAQRVYVSVPWSTVRSRGEDLAITRIELDAPVLDLPALQRWLASRPPGVARMPTLSDGLQIVDGRVIGDGWTVEDLELSLPRLQPDQPVDASVAGRFSTDAIDAFSLRFDVAVAMTRPASAAGIGIAGPITASTTDWRLPARVRLSAPLHFGDNGIRSARLRLSVAGHHESGDNRVPFAFAIAAPMRYRDGAVGLAPAGLALRGGDMVPQLRASGALAYGERLLIDLDGHLEAWPEAWPALPPPLGASNAPLPFALRYSGRGNLSDVATLRLRRDQARFDARLRIPDAVAWMASADDGTPLPPLSGRVVVPRLEISGAQLEGVEIGFDEPSLPDSTDAP